MSCVIDAAALMCVLLDEPGAEIVLPVLRGSAMSAVNLSETYSRTVERGATLSTLEQIAPRFEIEVHSFTADDAKAAAALRPLTRHVGASLGDRACLALAQRLGVPIYTGDRRLAELEVGIEIRLIR